MPLAMRVRGEARESPRATPRTRTPPRRPEVCHAYLKQKQIQINARVVISLRGVEPYLVGHGGPVSDPESGPDLGSRHKEGERFADQGGEGGRVWEVVG